MDDPRRILTADELTAASPTHWHQGGDALHITYATGDFATGLALVTRIGEVAESADHHPDLTLRYPSVTVTLTSHDVGGVTSRDLDMARRIDDLAIAAGVEATENT